MMCKPCQWVGVTACLWLWAGVPVSASTPPATSSHTPSEKQASQGGPEAAGEGISTRHQLASLPIWRDGLSEWLTYAVKAPVRGYTLEGEALVVVSALRKNRDVQGFRLNWNRFLEGEKGRFYHQAELEWSVLSDQLEKARWIRGQTPGGLSGRRLQKGPQGYAWQERLDEAKTDSATVLKSPLLLEESLFLEVRDWPLQPGFIREVWWCPLASGDRPPQPSVYARVEVVGGTQVLRDTQVWQVKVKPSQGRGAEIFVQCGGTHALLQATLSDGSTWSLEKVMRQ